jgi:polysulfide reductase chain C
MDIIWGNSSQYTGIVWPWPIAVYLFLAGLSAGSLMSALFVKLIGGNDTPPWDGLIKAGSLIAPLMIVVGLGLLIFDLGKPFSFWRLLVHYQLNSVMSIGVILLLLYSLLAFLFPMVIFKGYLSEAKWAQIWFPALRPVVNTLEKTGIWGEGVMVFFGIAVATYTGFLLSALVGKPLLNQPILPLLFLVSSLSAGIAASILLGLTLFEHAVEQKNLKYLLALDLRVIPFELFLLFVMFIGLHFLGGSFAKAGAEALTTGLWAGVFWIGVICIGLMLPVIIAITALHGHKYKLGIVLLNSTLVLVGVLVLRVYILYAGQIFTG